jgi:hypothetical protein
MLKRLKDFKKGWLVTMDKDRGQVFQTILIMVVLIFGIAVLLLADTAFLVNAYPNPAFVGYATGDLFFVCLLCYGWYLSFMSFADVGAEY